MFFGNHSSQVSYIYKEQNAKTDLTDAAAMNYEGSIQMCKIGCSAILRYQEARL